MRREHDEFWKYVCEIAVGRTRREIRKEFQESRDTVH